MTRHPTSFRFPDPTIAQLQRLAERFGNRTTAVIVAIDRLYQSERRDEMLIVKGQFPRNAHSRIPEDTPITTLSHHRLTARGTRNALRALSEAIDDYTETHGNRAAQAGWIECQGHRLSPPILERTITELDAGPWDASILIQAYHAEVAAYAQAAKAIAERDER